MTSRLGIHSIRPNKVLSFIAQAKLRGVTFPVVKAVDDTGTCIKVKEISPNTITITRFVTDNISLQGLEKWTVQDRINMAIRLMDYLFLRCKDSAGIDHPEIRANTNFFEIINEADPRGFYDFYGLFLIELVKEANKRNIKLALPAFNAGTPEWDDIVKIVNTGLFKLVKDTGHILSIHEGVFGTDQPIDLWYGDLIPGSPKVDGAGALCFRYKYLYSLLVPRNEVVPVVISEFYAGGGYTLAPDKVVERMKWYDTLAQKDSYVLAVLPFTIDPTPNWNNADYTYAYDAIINYMMTQLSPPNPTPNPTPVPTPIPVTKMLVGVHGRANGRMEQLDFQAVSTSKVEAVKLLSTADPLDVDTLKQIKPDMFIMVRLFVDFQNGRVLNSQQFVDSIKDDMKNFYNKGVRYFEIHNEPNIYSEGYSHSWKNGTDFTVWFNEVVRILKTLYPDTKLGFPGISPGASIPDVRADELQFIKELGNINADWVGVHMYWQTQQELDTISQNILPYAQKFNLPFYITEFSNPNTGIDRTTKAKQYLQFYSKIIANAAFSFVVSAPSGFESEVWRTEKNEMTVIPVIIGERISTMVGKKVTNTNPLNLRKGPGTNFEVVGTIAVGSVFTALEESNGWIRLTSDLWSKKDYLKLV